MKITIGKASILLFILAFLAMIAACFSPWEGDGATGTVIISVSGSTGRATTIPYPPGPGATPLEDIVHVVTFTRPGASPVSRTFTGATTGPITLSTGIWSLNVIAYENEADRVADPPSPYAQGSGSVNVAANTNTPASVWMAPVFPASSSNIWLQTPANVIIDDHTTLAAALGAITTQGAYTIWFTDDPDPLAVNPYDLASVPTGVTITLRTTKSGGVNVQLNAAGSLFTVPTDITLVLTSGVNLVGDSDNTSPLINVNGGTFNMNGGSIINNGSASTKPFNGGGVFVDSGTFNMSGGTISGNYADNGGGVAVNGGTFTMNSVSEIVNGITVVRSGSISGNEAIDGGGVAVNGGTFTMSGGSISGNRAAETNLSDGNGGGVYVGFAGIFSKTGGTIYGGNAGLNSNTSQYGNAVYVTWVGTSDITYRTEKVENNDLVGNFSSED